MEDESIGSKVIFFNGPLDEEVYLKKLPHFKIKGNITMERPYHHGYKRDAIMVVKPW